LAELAGEEIVSGGDTFLVDALGLAADRAKLLFWRHERLVLPLPYLDTDRGARLRGQLREALNLAEDAGRLMRSGPVEVSIGEKRIRVPSPFGVLAADLIGANGPIDDLVRHLAPGRIYWAALEEPFRQLLLALPGDVKEEDGRPVYGGREFPIWQAAIRRAAREAFQVATDGLGETARTLRAVALGDRELRRRLNALLGPSQGAGPSLAATGGNRR
ncbi:MAG: type I-E CRISPR-associated protein Cse1/CasA, partial [Dehalococcoidia bacterium]